MEYKNLDFDNMEECSRIPGHIYNRFRKGLYSIIGVSGLPGMGKSSLSIRLAEMISKKVGTHFDDTNICDSLLGLVELVRGKDSFGRIIVMEEMSVLFSSRRSMAGENVDVLKILDTIRKKQIILIANCPSINAIDSGIRFHLNVYIELKAIIKSKQVVIFKAFKYQVNVRSSKAYFHSFVSMKGSDINLFFARKPNEELWEKYEGSKDDFMEKLYEKIKSRAIEKELKEKKLSDKNVRMKITKSLSPRESEVFTLVFMKGLTQTEASKRLGIYDSATSNIIKSIKKKIQISDDTKNS